MHYILLIIFAAIGAFSGISHLGILSACIFIFLTGHGLLRISRAGTDAYFDTKISHSAFAFLIGTLCYSTALFVLPKVISVHLSQDGVRVAVLFVTIVITLATRLSYKVEVKTFLKQPIRFLKVLKQYAPLILIVLLSCVPGVINAIAQDNDSFLTTTLKYWRGAEIYVLDLRYTFSALQAFFAHLAGTSPLISYTWLPVLLFIAGILTLWDTRTKINYYLLSLVSAPVILTEIFITRPQVVLLSFCIPIFCLLSKSNEDKHIASLILAFAISLLLIPFHELAVVFFIPIFVIGARIAYPFATAAFAKNRFLPILWTIIALPYCYLLSQSSLFSQLKGISKYILSTVEALQLELWFIDSYTSVDGSQLGWPGIQSVYYYLYNGMLLIAVLILCSLLGKSKGSTLKTKIAPVAIFLAIFAFFAEIAPRFGFYFLLNRTWPYIALASLYIFITLLKNTKLASDFRVNTATVFVTLFGLAGIIQVANDNVLLVFPQEISAAEFIKTQSPVESVFISNQGNAQLVEINGERKFFQFNSKNEVGSVEQIKANALRSLHEHEQTIVTTINTTKTVDGVVTSTNTTSLTEKKNVPGSISSNTPVYYIFSKRKASGRNAERNAQYNQSPANISVLSQLSKDFPIAYEDEAVIITKLQ